MELKIPPKELDAAHEMGQAGGEEALPAERLHSSASDRAGAPQTPAHDVSAGGESPARETDSAANVLDTLQTGLEIGPDNRRFRLMRMIGHGDISRLWLAEDLSAKGQPEPQRFRALRIFLPQPDAVRGQEGLARDEGKAARLDLINLRAQLVKLRVRVEHAANLNHPNIAKVYGWRQGKDGWLFVETEYADQRSGSTLDRLLRSEARPGLSLERTLQLLYPVAEALDYAHREHRLAHRALKAEHIYVSMLGTVKLLNFGLEELEAREARETANQETGAAAQESRSELQAGDQARFKQDISALAALVYQMLTGRPPYETQLSAGWNETRRLPRPAELGEAAWKVLQQSLDPRNPECLPSALELFKRLGVVKRPGLAAEGRRSRTLLRPSVWVILGILIGGGAVWYVGQRVVQAPVQFSGQQTLKPMSGSGAEPEKTVAQASGTGEAPLQAGQPEAGGEAERQEEEQVKREMDDSAFAAAQRIATQTAYRIYLQRCPDCYHREAAQAAVKDLELKARIAGLKAQFESRLKARELASSNTNAAHTATAILAELEALNPQEPFLREGRRRIAQAYLELAQESLARGDFTEARNWLAKGEALGAGLEALVLFPVEIDRAERKARDDAAYAQAERLNTQKGYQAYLEDCTPPCGHRRDAELAIERLKSMPPSVSNTVFRDRLASGGQGPEMVVVPAGSFTMGSPAGERGRFSDEYPRTVQVPQAFAIGKFEVTFEEYQRFAEASGRPLPDDKGWGRGRRPVINVDWNDATAYAGWLSAQTGQRYRLPTEAEWEYAARGGSQAARFWGDDPAQGCNYANGADLDGKRIFAGWNAMNCHDGYVYTAPVGYYQPNGFGLHDMLGNVLEWTCSVYEEGGHGAEQRCEGKDRGLHFVYRGGSWSDEPRSLRAADRHKGMPDFRDYFIGFRVVRQL